MVKGIFAGSFDPFHYGHLDLINRSKKFCDQLIVAIGDNPAKKSFFSVNERIDLIERSLEKYSEDQVLVESFGGLLINYAHDVGATLLIRGIRSVSDFEYENNLAGINKALSPRIETLFMPTDPTLSVVSSSMVKEIVKHGGDVRQFVPPVVVAALSEKLNCAPK